MTQEISAKNNQAGDDVPEPSKVWIFPEDEKVPPELLEMAGGSRIVAALMYRRGIKTAEQASTFLDESRYTPTGPMELPDVDKAVQRITRAIEEKQHITVYGDYDVDGVTGTSVLLTVLKSLGADVDFYIPNRVGEGYGLNLKAVSVLASKKRTKLIITCDCGVSNFAEITFARSLGVDTLVLDHHTMPEVLPPAAGIVHPKRLDEDHPLFHLPGVGVAYKVCEALLIDNGKGEEAHALLDLVTLGMIADLVPLVRENRYLVKIGLPVLARTERAGLKALLGQVNGKTDADQVGFGIAPRINAAGRLSDANKAVELMTTADQERADELANELQQENSTRQELCERIFEEADYKVRTTPGWQDRKCIAIYDPGWHHGVVGIVASRLVERYHRPVFIGQLDRDEGMVKGSARGVEAIDLYEVLKANEHLMLKWGGHKMAAGFSVEAGKADELCRALVATCNKLLKDKPLSGVVQIDLVVEPEEVSLELARELNVMAPFGMGNRKPRLCMRQLSCTGTRALGKEGKHSRIMLAAEPSAAPFECVMWNSRGRVPAVGESVDLVFTPEVNHFNNRDRLQLVVSDWRTEHHGTEVTDLSQVKIQESAPPVMASGDSPAGASSPPVADAGASDAAEERISASTGGARLNDAERLAAAAESLDVPLKVRPSMSAGAVKQSWKDLRSYEDGAEVLARARSRLGGQLAVFSESCQGVDSSGLFDRTAMVPSRHLLLWQFPPTLELFSSLLAAVQPDNVYLLGSGASEYDEPAAFLRRLYGLARYAVNQKDSQVEGEKLAALMGSSMVALALGLTVFKRAHMIDWYAEDGTLFLDLLDGGATALEDCAEYAQLAGALEEIKSFRRWCAEAPVKEIQLSLVKHGVSLAPQQSEGLMAGLGTMTGESYDNTDGQEWENGINAPSQS